MKIVDVKTHVMGTALRSMEVNLIFPPTLP